MFIITVLTNAALRLLKDPMNGQIARLASIFIVTAGFATNITDLTFW